VVSEVTEYRVGDHDIARVLADERPPTNISFGLLW